MANYGFTANSLSNASRTPEHISLPHRSASFVWSRRCEERKRIREASPISKTFSFLILLGFPWLPDSVLITARRVIALAPVAAPHFHVRSRGTTQKVFPQEHYIWIASFQRKVGRVIVRRPWKQLRFTYLIVSA